MKPVKTSWFSFFLLILAFTLHKTQKCFLLCEQQTKTNVSTMMQFIHWHKKIVHRRSSNINLVIFACSFQVFQAS